MTDIDHVDTLGMFEAAASLPDQVEQAIEYGRGVVGLPDRAGIENVVVLGMGGSGIAGDVIAAVAGPFMPVPVTVATQGGNEVRQLLGNDFDRGIQEQFFDVDAAATEHQHRTQHRRQSGFLLCRHIRIS